MNNVKITMQLFAAVLLCTVISSTYANAQDAPKLTDPQVASAAVAANQVDINHAIIALERSDNPAVRKFAKKMIGDHTSVIQQATALAMKLGVTPEGNAVTNSLQNRAKKVSKMLKSKWGMAFDKAYIDNEVAYHKAVISAVKNVLIPQTKNGQLKSLLEEVVPILNHHLHMAEMAQNKIE